ncbi:hypothetical protein ACOI1H_16325 [Loktanella sp. DJP18]|uniref:hypothetical protein n=1 Tax=Loktanella sp. DJP18 TaxID=3409788 RepID=UPI003BB6E421
MTISIIALLAGSAFGGVMAALISPAQRPLRAVVIMLAGYAFTFATAQILLNFALGPDALSQQIVLGAALGCLVLTPFMPGLILGKTGPNL